MRRHSFDPVSAALGILAVAIGILVASTGIDDLGDDTGRGSPPVCSSSVSP